MISERELSHYSNKGELNFRKFLGKTEIKKVKREFSNFVKYKINKMILGKDYSLSKSKKKYQAHFIDLKNLRKVISTKSQKKI